MSPRPDPAQSFHAESLFISRERALCVCDDSQATVPVIVADQLVLRLEALKLRR